MRRAARVRPRRRPASASGPSARCLTWAWSHRAPRPARPRWRPNGCTPPSKPPGPSSARPETTWLAPLEPTRPRSSTPTCSSSMTTSSSVPLSRSSPATRSRPSTPGASPWTRSRRASISSPTPTSGPGRRTSGPSVTKSSATSSDMPPAKLPRVAGIVVTSDLTPTHAARLDPSTVLGIVMAAGSAVSHGAILARALGIPAVVGAGPDVLAVPDGTTIVVDGTAGRRRRRPRRRAPSSATDQGRRATPARQHAARDGQPTGNHLRRRAHRGPRQHRLPGRGARSSSSRRRRRRPAPHRVPLPRPSRSRPARTSSWRPTSRSPRPSATDDSRSARSTSVATNPSRIYRRSAKPTRSSAVGDCG